jgi:hypothetical protein
LTSTELKSAVTWLLELHKLNVLVSGKAQDLIDRAGVNGLEGLFGELLRMGNTRACPRQQSISILLMETLGCQAVTASGVSTADGVIIQECNDRALTAVGRRIAALMRICRKPEVQHITALSKTWLRREHPMNFRCDRHTLNECAWEPARCLTQDIDDEVKRRWTLMIAI